MFTWDRLRATERRLVDASVDVGVDVDVDADADADADAPRFWTAFQRQQQLATALLHVHALSTALAYEPHAPLRVDAVQWWYELQQQSAMAVRQRRTRKRRLQSTPSPAVLTGPITSDDDLHNVQDEVFVDALVQLLHSLSLWARTTDRDRADFPELLMTVKAAMGDVGLFLLDAWSHNSPQCAVHVVNVLLQFDGRVGSFHAFHEHKLCASTPERLFRTTPRWSCSKCARSWETHGANVSIRVFHCAACAFTLCRECFTRIPNATLELEEVAVDQELFRVHEPLQTQRFLSLVMSTVLKQNKTLFATVAPQLAVAVHGRLQELLLYRSQEVIPLMQMVLDLFSLPEFPRLFIQSESQLWLPMFISASKLRLHSFLAPLLWFTSMSDEPGEINLTAEGRRDGSPTTLTLEWLEGYHELRAMLNQLFDAVLANSAQDPFVVDALITYLAAAVVCIGFTRNSGQNTDDLYDAILINMSSALVHVMLPVLENKSHVIQTQYHESYIPQRVYLSKFEPLQSKAADTEPALRAADDRRVQAADAQHLAANEPPKEFFYPPIEKHFGVLCDFCHGADFQGFRYKCAICDDADICASCFDEFAQRPILSDAEQVVAKAQSSDQYHCTDHVFLRLDVPMPLLAASHYMPVEYHKAALLYGDSSADSAKTVAQEVVCAECSALLDAFDVYYRCSNCLEPRLVCPACLTHEERHHDPNHMHLPGHTYLAIPRPWRQAFNPRVPGLHSRGLVYPACIYPRERFNTETELMYITIEALHFGPLHSLSRVLTTVKEMQELRAFCACEEQRIEYEKRQSTMSSRRPPKLSAHHAASQARLTDLGATRLMAELHLLEATNVIDWLTFYARTCRWLLRLASPTQNALYTIVTHFSNAFSAFPQHFFFDLCDMVHVLTLDGTSGSTQSGIGGLDYQTAMVQDSNNTAELLEPLLVMLVQLLATRQCTKNPHLRVQAAKALLSLVSFFAKNTTLASALRKVLKQSIVLRDFAVQAVLQFHEDMESYHIRNNGLVFNTAAGSGDHLLWGFLSIRLTTTLLLRFLWQFPRQRTGLERAFRSKARSLQQGGTDAMAESRIANQVSMLLTGLWSDAAKLLEEGNAKVSVLTQLADIREALLEGRQIQLPFRPTMLEGYIALHSKHLRISMRMLVEVLELLSWMADHTPLKRAMLKPELSDQCARTTSFLMASLVSAFRDQTLDFTWHHLADSKRVFAHLVFLVTRCATLGAETSASPSQYWSLVHDSGHAMLRFIGDVEVHNRWTLNSAVVRMESARYLGAGTDDGEAEASQPSQPSQPSRMKEPLDEDDGLDENDALALLEQQSAQALDGSTIATSSRSKKNLKHLARQLGNRFVSALAKDGRFDYDAFLNGCDLLIRQGTDDYELVGVAWMTLYRDVLRRCQDMVSLQASMDELLSDIPDEFLDPLLSTIMTDPVRLPSGNVVDRSVIERHLLSTNRVDPFTREPLTLEMLTPCEPLRRKIQLYLRTKLQHLAPQKENVLATWGLAWDCIFDVVGP